MFSFLARDGEALSRRRDHVLRTTQVLGYKSFAEFAAALRQHFVARITPYTVLKSATREKRSVADHLDQALDKALDNLNILKSNLDKQKVIDLARTIKRSRHVLVVGLDLSPSFLTSYVAPMAAISALHVACAHIDPNRSLSRLRPTDREYASGHRWYRESKRSNGTEP